MNGPVSSKLEKQKQLKKNFIWPSDLNTCPKRAAFQLGYLDLGPPLVTFIVFIIWGIFKTSIRGLSVDHFPHIIEIVLRIVIPYAVDVI